MRLLELHNKARDPQAAQNRITLEALMSETSGPARQCPRQTRGNRVGRPQEDTGASSYFSWQNQPFKAWEE